MFFWIDYQYQLHMDLRSDFINEVKGIIEQSRLKAIRSVDLFGYACTGS